MNSAQLLAYMITGIALAASCIVFAFSSRLMSSRFMYYVLRVTPGIALLSLLFGLTLRSITAGRWPIGTTFEFTLAFAASVVLVYLSIGSPPFVVGASAPENREARTINPLPGAIASLLALLLMAHAFFIQTETARAIQPLPPVMRGVWFALHTLLTTIAYGALALAGGLALGNILISIRHSLGGLPVTALVDRSMAIGYVTLSLGMIAGGIWGELAWGDYWNWSIKEGWTLILWLVCTLYYHVRHRHGWRGRRAMLIAVLALIAVCVTFFFTPTLLHWTRLQRWRIY